jgi:peptidyl-prolyl cis-trans isomerase D
MMKDDLAERQLTEPIRASAISPDILTREVYAFQDETRVADAVALPFAAAPPPETPTEAQLQRWHDNHLDQYSTPEYRKIKIVLLSPEIVGKDIPIAEDDITQAYNARRAEFRQPERRSVQVLLAADEAEANKLAETWRAGADWTAMQKANASAVELPDATQESFPAPELGAAAFAAAAGTVAPPVKSALGWHVFKVTKITPGVDKSLADVHDDLRAHLVADKAADLVFERSAKIEDMLAGGTSLDDLPGDFGLAAATGTLDARGLQPDGTPAPVPGDDATRQAIITAAFAMQKDQPAHLTEAPRDAEGLQGYFAVVVEDITPPAPRPLADILDSVRADWTRDARRHAQEEAATAIMTGVKAGKTLAEAAPGLTVTRLAPAGRASGGEGVPPQLVQPLFHLKPGEPTMVETLDGFTVAVLAQVNPPDAAAPAYGKTRDQLAEAVGNDMLVLLRIALRNRSNPKISATILDNVAQSE